MKICKHYHRTISTHATIKIGTIKVEYSKQHCYELLIVRISYLNSEMADMLRKNRQNIMLLLVVCVLTAL